MSKARTLANLISDNAELADGQISVAEVVGAAPTASPTFTGTVNADAITMSGFLTVNGGADFNTVLYPDGISMADSRTISFGTSANFELNGGSTFLDFNLKDNARHLRIKNGLVEHHRFSGNGSVVFNDSGADADFRVESDNNPNMLFVNGGQNNVGIGKAPGSGQGALQIAPQVAATNYYRPAGNYAIFGDSGGNGEHDWVYLSGSYTDTDKSVGFAMQDYNGNFGNYVGSYIRSNQAKVRIGHFVGGANSGTAPSLADNFIFDTAGGAVFNERGANGDFRVESDARDHAFFLEGSSSKIGINQSNPAAMLDIVTVSTAGADAIRLKQPSSSETYQLQLGISGATNEGLVLRNTASTGMLQQWRANEVVINDDGVDRDFRVESDAATHAIFVEANSSYVKMGKSSDSNGEKNLGVMIGCEGASSNGRIGSTSNSNSWFSKYGSDGEVIKFHKTDGTNVYNVGSISVTSSGTTYNTTSDRRLKDNIEPIADATDKLMSMKPVTHTWIANPEAPSVHGFIAQEMQEVVPEAVSGEDGGEEMMSMDYGRITPVLVAALQEAINEIKALEERLTKMEVN
jgi:hypothetical protein